MGESIEFNHEMLTLARESRGLTQTDMARDLDISQGEISKIENGLRVPNMEQMGRFSRYLRYEEEFFFLTERVRSFGTSCIYHRKRLSTPEHILRYLCAMVNVSRIQLGRLLLSVDLQVENKFRPMDIEDHDSPEEIAQTVRGMWKLPPGPIFNLVREVEDAGGIVIRCEFGTAKVDAVSQWVGTLPPLFFVNSRIPTDRLRFTLAHEIGHIIMHRLPSDNMEGEADRFASELLMPEREIRTQLSDLTLPRLATLKGHWRVSMSALLKRAGDLGTMTSDATRRLWVQIGKYGYRKREPILIPPEEPSILGEIISTHRKDLGYTQVDFSKMLWGLDTALAEALKTNSTRLKLVGQ